MNIEKLGRACRKRFESLGVLAGVEELFMQCPDSILDFIDKNHIIIVCIEKPAADTSYYSTAALAIIPPPTPTFEIEKTYHK